MIQVNLKDSVVIFSITHDKWIFEEEFTLRNISKSRSSHPEVLLKGRIHCENLLSEYNLMLISQCILILNSN